jgi:hypothetical protein
MTSPTRVDLLLRQLDESYTSLRARLDGLTDDEYFWEPVPGCVTLRAVDGRWQPDRGYPETTPPPFTTIARRLSHVSLECLLARWEHTFGDRKRTLDDFEYCGSATQALAQLDEAFTKWRTGLDGLSDADLDVVGLSAMPWGLDPTLPFGDILWWNNRELIHHGAEMAMMRDLWAHSAGGTAFR